MPKINYNNMPYEKQYSTGEKTQIRHFYDPPKDYEEKNWKGYYIQDYFGLKIENLKGQIAQSVERQIEDL